MVEERQTERERRERGGEREEGRQKERGGETESRRKERKTEYLDLVLYMTMQI